MDNPNRKTLIDIIEPLTLYLDSSEASHLYHSSMSLETELDESGALLQHKWTPAAVQSDFISANIGTDYKTFKKSYYSTDMNNITFESFESFESYFGFVVNTNTPYYKAMKGDIPLTPNIFECIVDPIARDDGKRLFEKMRDWYNKRDLNGIDYTKHSGISPPGWTKSQLYEAIVESGVPLTWSIITGDPADKSQLPGVTSSISLSMKKVYYQQLYRTVYSTESKSVSWSLYKDLIWWQTGGYKYLHIPSENHVAVDAIIVKASKLGNEYAVKRFLSIKEYNIGYIWDAMYYSILNNNEGCIRAILTNNKFTWTRWLLTIARKYACAKILNLIFNSKQYNSLYKYQQSTSNSEVHNTIVGNRSKRFDLLVAIHHIKTKELIKYLCSEDTFPFNNISDSGSEYLSYKSLKAILRDGRFVPGIDWLKSYSLSGTHTHTHSQKRDLLLSDERISLTDILKFDSDMAYRAGYLRDNQTMTLKILSHKSDEYFMNLLGDAYTSDNHTNIINAINILSNMGKLDFLTEDVFIGKVQLQSLFKQSNEYIIREYESMVAEKYKYMGHSSRVLMISYLNNRNNENLFELLAQQVPYYTISQIERNYPLRKFNDTRDSL